MSTWVGNNVTVSGGNVARIRYETQLASQNTGGNYSTINYQVYIDFFGCDAQLDNGYADCYPGVLYNNGGRVYNYASNFSNHTVTMATGSYNQGHDANGNGSFYGSARIAVYQSGTSSTSGSAGLPRIGLAPGIYGITADTITPTSARLGGEITGYGHGTSANMNMYVRLQGTGGWTDLGNQGDVGGYNYWTASGLQPGKTYEYIMNVWNNNGDFSQSSTQTFKTLPVSGMITVMRAAL